MSSAGLIHRLIFLPHSVRSPLILALAAKRLSETQLAALGGNLKTEVA